MTTEAANYFQDLFIEMFKREKKTIGTETANCYQSCLQKEVSVLFSNKQTSLLHVTHVHAFIIQNA